MSTHEKAARACPLILALDLDSPEAVFPLLNEIKGKVRHVKIGPRLYFQGGHTLIRQLVEKGYKVFLDLKLHDIPNTVGMAVEALCELGIWALTVHTSGGIPMMAAAKQAISEKGSDTLLLGVTVLTSLSGQDWDKVHPGLGLKETLIARAAAAESAKIDGVVCSPLDLETIKSSCNLLTVVPGIRMHHGGDDQARIATPCSAMSAGADYLVVGRPILNAENCLKAVEMIQQSMEEGLAWR